MRKKFIVAVAALIVVCAVVFMVAAQEKVGDEQWVVKEPGGKIGNYRVGDLVLDAGGTLWEYEGNFMLEVRRGEEGPGLLNVRINGKKERVCGIHPETIPNVIDGDTFKQINPSLGVECKSEKTSLRPGLPPCTSGYCNYSEGDVCIRVYCGD